MSRPAAGVRAFAPATVGNVACGFDVLGFALDRPGDEVRARLKGSPGVVLERVTGDGGRLPTDARRNTAGVAAAALLDLVGGDRGVALELRKGLPLASGLGSSAASAVAAVVAVDALLGTDLPRAALLDCALEGERVASGSRHPDNAAPALYGGFILVRSVDPLDLVSLPCPSALSAAVVRPHLEIETAAARALLPESIPLTVAITQWANLGGLVAGLCSGDLELIGRSLRDEIAEPARAGQVPGFYAAQQAALDAGALGCSLSGSGPSVFALCRSLEEADGVAAALAEAFASEGLAADRHVSAINRRGAFVR